MRRLVATVGLLLLGIVHGSVYAQTTASTRPKGDQHREYNFAPTGQQMPYRLYVPTHWDGKQSLPIPDYFDRVSARAARSLK